MINRSLAVASLPSPADNIRPNAVSLIWDRDTASMPLPSNDTVSKDTPIITHCVSFSNYFKSSFKFKIKGPIVM